MLLVGLTVVLVAIVFVALVLAGVLPGAHNPSSAATATGFATARGQAQSAADGYGGSWVLVSASAVIPSQTISAPLNGSSLSAILASSGCTYTPLASGTESVSGVANVSQGDSEAWFFLFRNSSNDLLFVSETPVSTTLAGLVTGGCTSYIAYLNPIPTTVVDSSTAALAADASGGFAFLRAHGGANATLSLVGGATVFGASSPAFWEIAYTDCPLSPANVQLTAPAFSANVSAVSGEVITARSYSASCPFAAGTGPSNPSLNADLALGPIEGTTHGSTGIYAASVQSASPELAADDLSFSVQTSTGEVVALSAGSVLNIASPGGNAVASYAMGSGIWTFGGSVLVSAGESLTLTTTTGLSGMGYVLYIGAQSPYLGSVIAPIP